MTSFGTCVALTLFMAALAATGIGPTAGNETLRVEHAQARGPLSLLLGAVSSANQEPKGASSSEPPLAAELDVDAYELPPPAREPSCEFVFTPSANEHARESSIGVLRKACEWRVIQHSPPSLPPIGRCVLVAPANEPL